MDMRRQHPWSHSSCRLGSLFMCLFICMSYMCLHVPSLLQVDQLAITVVTQAMMKFEIRVYLFRPTAATGATTWWTTGATSCTVCSARPHDCRLPARRLCRHPGSSRLRVKEHARSPLCAPAPSQSATEWLRLIKLGFGRGATLVAQWSMGEPQRGRASWDTAVPQ